MKTELRYCGLCAHSHTDGLGRVHCDAPTDAIAVKNGQRGANPIWYERKFGSIGLIVSASPVRNSGLAGPGTDPRNMQFDDGAKCGLWKKRK
jgi:hypothetical protein